MLETCPKHNVIRVQSATQWTASGGVGWVGWGGVGWGWWHSLNSNTWWMLRNCACLVIAHMVDATQLCGGVGWGGVGMMTFFELEHMVDATQLCLSCHCTHGGCYATVRWGGVGWGGDDDILWTRTHGGCYATVLVLSLHTWWMLRNCAVGWGGVGWGWWHSLNLNTWWMLRNCACLVIAHMGNPGSWSRVLCNPVNTYGNCMMQSARGQQPGTWLFRVYTSRGWYYPGFLGIIIIIIKRIPINQRIMESKAVFFVAQMIVLVSRIFVGIVYWNLVQIRSHFDERAFLFRWLGE